LSNSTTTYGLVRSANTSNISITSGQIDVGTNIPKLNVSNTFTQVQNVLVLQPTYTASWTPNLLSASVFSMTLTGDLTLTNPSDATPGQSFIIIFKQDATGGHTITYGTDYKFPSGLSTSISWEPNTYTVLSIHCISSSLHLVTISRGFV